MTPERRIQIDKEVTWAILSLSKEEYDDWMTQNLYPEEYFTGREGILYDWCERCEYLNYINDCQEQNCRLKNEKNSNSD
jgi:hypothetical protein